MESNNILIKVGADITDFSRKMKAATSDLDKFQAANRETFDSFKKVGGAITAGGVGIAAGLGLAVKEAASFEGAFAGVRKTVDATEEEFAILKQGIRDMSKELPTSANEIAGVSEAAGQLGIEKESILGFTRTMVDLGVATNMSAEEAATALARFANITNMSQSDFDRLGSTIVDLGNNFATTEGEIVDMALRLAGAGAQVGMSEADILGLSTALSSVGVQAEMGGSAISKALVNMQVATSTGFEKMNGITDKTGLSLRELQLSASNTPKHFTKVAESLGMTKTELSNVMKSASDLENFAKISGMTAGEFKQAFEKDAVGALGSFINGLGGAEAAGDSAINMLTEMGISEVRLRDSLLRAGNASELFAGAIDVANGAWDENVALTNEANERYKTFESRFEMFKNAIKDVGVTIGDVLMPAIGGILDKLSELITWFGNLNPTVITVITVVTALVGALALIVGPLLLLIGFIPSIISGFAAIGTVISAVTAFFAPAAAGAAGVAGATSGLGTVLAAITGPVGIAVAAIAGIIAILVLAYNKVDWFRDFVDRAWTKIKEVTIAAFKAVKEFLTNVFKDIVSFGSAQLDKFKAFWDENGKAIMTLVSTYFKNIWEVIKGVMGVIKGIFEVVWPIISGVIKIAWELIKATIGNTLDVILGIIQTVMKLLQGDWEGAWNTIKETADKIWKNIVKFFEDVDLLEIGKDIIKGLINGISSMVDAAKDAVKNVASNIKNAVTDFFDIHSPSRVMAGIGKNIGEGLAIGIDATKSVNKSAISGLADVIKSVAVASNAEIAAINRKAAEDEKAVREKAAKDIEYIIANAKERKRKLTLAESMRIQRIEADEVAKIKKIREDANKAWQREAVENDKKRLNAIKDFVSEKKSLEQASLIDEVNIWRKSVEYFEDGTDAKIAAQIEYKNAIKRVNDEIASINEKFSKRMADISGKLTDDITRANEELATKSKAIKDKLIADEQRLNDEYAKAFEQRYNSLRNFAGLFDKFDMSPKETGGELLDNLKSQVDGFKSWESQIATLSERAIDDGLLDELRQMGPKALPQLLALNSMTDDQLTQYSGLYREKSAMARTETERQMAGMRADTQRQLSELRAVANAELTQLNIETRRNIASMRAVANAELATLQTEWTRSIQSVTKATDDEFKTLTQIGKNAGQNLLDGLASMESSLVAKATSIARAVNSALQSTLGGSVSVAPYKTPTPATGVGSSVATSSTAATAGGITQNITINSTTPISPAEAARKQKQASQQLAMEWGMR